MCTVSVFYKGNSDFVLTSNRDEAPNRIALHPEIYQDNLTKVLMPKDKLSGGSWIGASSKNRVVCLLNGGFVKHKRVLPYRQSRGVVVSDFLKMKTLEDLKDYNFSNIEPFTIVFVDWNLSLKFIEVVWDGQTSHIKDLDLSTCVWSSATLYNPSQKIERQNWFTNFIGNNNLNASAFLEFHKTAGKDNLDYGVVMDRTSVKTTSITQIEKNGNTLSMRFEDFKTKKVVTKKMQLSAVVNG